MRMIRDAAAATALRQQERPAAGKRAITTLCFPRRVAWGEQLDMIDAEAMSAPALVRRLVSESKRYEAMVLNGDGSPISQLAAAAMIARRRSPPPLIFADCAWGVDKGFVDRAATRFIDGPHVHYCVHSREQRSCFPDLWGVDIERVHVTPYYFTLSEEELAMPAHRDGSVFAGGRSRRRFSTLIEAAHRIDAPVTIGGRVPAKERKRAPRNLRAELLPHDQFISLLSRASVVVVPLEQAADRSAGEQMYLNAMVLGKPVIVTDTMGVRDYVEHVETGLIVPPGDVDALVAALKWALDPANDAEVSAMAQRARRTALTRFSPDDYIASLLSVLGEVLNEASQLEKASTVANGDRMPLKRALQRTMRTGYRIVAATPLRPILGTSVVRRLKRRSLEMPADVVPSVLEALRAGGVSAWLVGGWGIDALVGEQTRRHRDLDVVFNARSDAEQRAVSALADLGFKFVKREAVPGSDPGCWLSTRLVMADDAGRLVDLHPVEFPLVVASGTDERKFSPQEAFVTGSVSGRPVLCLSAALQLALHEGYEARDIDREDIARLLLR
jgi:lincosamide nucleotidyltransferase A/C/D/E